MFQYLFAECAVSVEIYSLIQYDIIEYVPCLHHTLDMVTLITCVAQIFKLNIKIACLSEITLFY